MNEALLEAIRSVAQPDVLLVILCAAAYGIFVGSIPGLTATMAVALMVPMTFFLSDIQAVAAIVTTVTCSIFAGDIPATLIRIPGTPASAAYATDAYRLTQQGEHRWALGLSLTFSVIGGLFGVLVLATAAPLLAKFASRFTSFEYFWLFVLGLTCAATVSGQSLSKASFALFFGMFLSTVGLGADYSRPRLTFGLSELIMGINFIPAMIGLFGVSEILRNALVIRSDPDSLSNSAPSERSTTTKSLKGLIPYAGRRSFALVRSSTIGAFIGMLPGAGADIAAWISYAVSRKFSRQPEKYGEGSEEGLSDATGANNAALGSAWIPALVFGIPGDSVTAIALGVLLMKNISPGPDIFDVTKPQAILVYSIYVAFILANLMLIPLGLLAIQTGSMLIRIPRRILLPLILMFCIVGSFAMKASYFDVGIMMVMGIVGFIFDRFKVPLGPVVLGIILGGEVEHRFIQCIQQIESPVDFVSSGISITLACICILLWLSPLFRRKSAD